MAFFSRNKNSTKNELIIITGCAGSGKSTIGRKLAQQLNYTYLDKDTITREFTDFVLVNHGSSEGDRESDFYVNQIVPIEYSITFKLASEIIAYGSNVVLTIPFINQIKDYEKWLQICRENKALNNIDIKFIWIEHDINNEHRNIQKRNAKRDEYKLKHWQEYSRSVYNIKPDNRYNAISLSNDINISLDLIVKELIKCLRK